MESSQVKRNRRRLKRTLRNRKKVRGSSERPRLSVFKSAKHIYAQIIDDETGKTLASASTMVKKGEEAVGKVSKEIAFQIGKKIADKAKGAKVARVVFDRGRHKYHGVVASLADGAREGGIEL